ncbi:sulfatase-like hydrolase/transferase [Roseimaritima sediminicola]|uniref:sulfatase-like hydrolase/transferase n=1 Tax=Roseimaritima sediminicola TaxID=2662066 RepID=UPI00129835F6|nr:sulfatase-like hydrolase/transferase [Roseimaritima sediminicola]
MPLHGQARHCNRTAQSPVPVGERPAWIPGGWVGVTARLVGCWLFLTTVAFADRPNILLVMTDDQGYGDVAVHGNHWIKTPNMDRIANEGARFERFFVEPVCAPTRAALLSGRYPTRTGVTGVTRGYENMRGEEVTIAELLKDAGYKTGCFGKWHNGAHWPYHPNAQGFDEFVGFCAGHCNDYFDPLLERNGSSFQARGFIADVLTDHAIEFIQRAHATSDSPFFCYVPYNTPHTPASVPVDKWQQWAERPDVEDPFTRAMYALVENIDDNLGRLLAKLEQLGIAEETVIVFLTDNGPNGHRFNDQMRGIKSSEHEGGVRVPLFVRWSQRIPPGTVVKPNAAHIDLLPTLCRIAGVENPASKTLPLDGLDLTPLLFGQDDFEMPERNLYVWRNPNRWSVRSARYRATEKSLHDLVADPSQQNNLARTHPEVHRSLIESYRDWAAKATPQQPQPLPVPIGYEPWPRVTVAAHELDLYPEPGRGIDYCGRRGWAHQWIEDWSDPQAYAACPVEVVSGGEYRVRIRYACPEDAVGSVFRLTAGPATLDIPIQEPWVSAPHPAPERVPKSPNAYLSRQWKESDAGVVSLEEGRHRLELQAAKKPAAEMPEIKALIFERVP